MIVWRLRSPQLFKFRLTRLHTSIEGRLQGRVQGLWTTATTISRSKHSMMLAPVSNKGRTRGGDDDNPLQQRSASYASFSTVMT